MTDYQAAMRRIETTALNTCPGCGKTDTHWSNPWIVTTPEVGGGKIKDEGPEFLLYACMNCGCARFFATELRQPK
jgi:hypothetical protein